MTAFTWNDRGIPDKCEDKDNQLYHSLLISSFNNIFVWHYGDYDLEPFQMDAGQIVTIELEWNFSNEAHAKDWSLVAYGDGRVGTLHLAHDKGLKSDSWNHIPR